MTIAFAESLRNAQLDQITTALDAGLAAGKIRIYNGIRPTAGGTVTTLLAELTLSYPCAAAAAAGVWSADPISPDTSADATGTATWFRLVDATGVFVMDGDVGIGGSGAELILNSTSITIGQQVAISSLTITIE